MFKQLLVPTDGSELSLRAIGLAVDLAKTCGARVHAVHVVRPFHAVSYLAEMLAATEQEYCQEAEARARRYLAEVSAVAKRAGVPCETASVVGDSPHLAIAKAAEAQGCDLIVMASHGWKGWNRLLLGSETHKLMLATDIPVLVCH